MTQNPAARPPVHDPASVDAAIVGRMSVRGFLPRPVPREVLEHLLALASRAPSGTNTQPWKVYVLQGVSKDALVGKVCAAHDAMRDNPALAADYQEAYDYYPKQWVSPYIDRRRENGWGLYGLLGIGKGDKDKMHAQHQRNFRFFDAPVGLMVTIDKVMGGGSLVDTGMFLQNLMVAARGARARHLPASGLEQLCPYHPASHRRGRQRNAGLRPGARLCRPGGQGQHLSHPPRTGGRLHHLARLSPSRTST